ncbi:transglycosylase domain-containing protein [Anaerorhabdus sp.]|uniref:transglycosylase domain-containing protein n=1 Tax=Anaerorhabdus sp. TaxID=1872524 RepID=UPI002FC897C3
MKLKRRKTTKTASNVASKPKPKRKVNRRNLVAMIISILVACEIIVGCAGLFVLFNMLSDKPAFDITQYESKESSQIYDQNGELIADVGKQIRSNVTYDQVPTSLIDAFVSIEDSRFFGHNGFDMARFGKAMLENLKSLSFAQGGSTLSMQLTKMTYFMDDESGIGAPKKIGRKVQEIALALELENNTNKKAIFEMYLNKSNFGGTGNIRGVQKAANYYFNKDVSELTLPESAMLAGVVNAPGLYNPFRYLDYATNRRNTVLNMMLRHGYITKEEADLAKSIAVEDLLVDPNTKKSDSVASDEYAYQSYIDTVTREVQELTGLDPTSTSMKIYTYMDKDVQATMDLIQSDSYEGVEFPDELMEIGMVSMNNQNGQVIAVGGGRNYGRGGSLLLNHATDQYKQPGSAVKPFLDYALAFEFLGWSTSHVVTDRPIIYRGTTKVIKNFNGHYNGQITLESAVGNSWNTPAMQALDEVIVAIGREKVVEYLQNLGFSKVTLDKFDLGYAIGGSSFECSVFELAAAQAAMMNGGNYYKPHTVSRIEFADGREPLEPTYTGTQVISAEAAYQTAYIMSKAPYAPYQNYMQMVTAGKDYQVYGKTGTTDWGTEGLQFGIPKGAAKDKWMVIETSQITNVVWVGYEKGVKDKDTYFTKAKNNMNIPGKISRALLTATSDETKPEPVAKPEGVTQITHILGTWPYAATIEGMDPRFVTTGYIKKEFAELVSPDTANVEQLNNFTASGSNDGSVSINWGAYPNPDQLQVAPETMDLSLSENGVYVEAWGPRIFDYTWIFGPIRYKARISEGGSVIKEVVSESNTWTENLGLGGGNHTLQVCGYYAYDWLGTPSNEICQDVQVNIAFDTTNAEGCKASGKYWWTSTNTCSDEKPDETTERGCKEFGKYWYGNACHVDPETTTPPTACPADATGEHPNCQCTDPTKTYDKTTNACVVKP